MNTPEDPGVDRPDEEDVEVEDAHEKPDTSHNTGRPTPSLLLSPVSTSFSFPASASAIHAIPSESPCAELLPVPSLGGVKKWRQRSSSGGCFPLSNPLPMDGTRSSESFSTIFTFGGISLSGIQPFLPVILYRTWMKGDGAEQDAVHLRLSRRRMGPNQDIHVLEVLFRDLVDEIIGKALMDCIEAAENTRLDVDSPY